ncbi:MAG: hypothetical protein GTO18_10800 [Anaerolineales bacterium]|nr:hypothetical protein [Anaerolineales bacterium]
MEGDNYIALIGDVVRSREVTDRGGLQERLRGGIIEVNEQFKSKIAASFVLTIGDEFQGLLWRAEGLDRLLAHIRSFTHPVELRFGLGIGGLETELRQIALGMDGPCFHRARDAIERAEAMHTYVEVDVGADDNAFAIYALLYSASRRDWTERQRQVLDLAMAGLSGKAIASQLGVTPSAVSQHLQATEADAILAATSYWLDALTAAQAFME